jgi:hypothetical protein
MFLRLGRNIVYPNFKKKIFSSIHIIKINEVNSKNEKNKQNWY